MIKQIKNKIQFAAIAAPIYAAESLELTGKSETFANLENLTISGMVSGAISLVLIIVSLIFFFILVIGGLKWITSGGDEKRVAAARAQITNALIGLVIVFAAWAIMKLIGSVFGVNLTGEIIEFPTF
jgi:type IV secretion system pilin